MGTKPYTEVQSHFRGNESSLFSSSRVSMRIRWEFLLLSAVPSERWPPFITPEQCHSFAVSLQDQAHTMLLPTPSLISVTFAPPCFKSVILAWQHKTAEIKEMWLRQTGSNHGVLSQTSYVTLGCHLILWILAPSSVKMGTQCLSAGVMKITWYVTIKCTAHCLVYNRYPKSWRVIIIIIHHCCGTAISRS